MPTLNERLETLEKSLDKQSFIEVLLNSKPNDVFGERIERKYSDDLSVAIGWYLYQRGADVGNNFSNKLYRSFTPKREKRIDGRKARKHALLTIIDGIKYSTGVPDEVFKSLDGWESIYFLAGYYKSKTSGFVGDRYTRVKLSAWTAKETIARTIAIGIVTFNPVQERIGKILPHREEIYGQCQGIITRNPLGYKQMDLF